MTKNRKSLAKIILSTMLCCTLVFLTVMTPAFPVYADELSDLQSRYNEIEKKMKENEKKMAELDSSMESQNAKIDALEGQIDGFENQIQLLDESIAILKKSVNEINDSILVLDEESEKIKAEIDETKQKMADTELHIEETKATLLNRLATSYMLGESSTLEFLFGSNSLADILSRKQYMQNASDYDDSLIKGLEDDIAGLQKMKEKYDGQVIYLEETKKAVEAKRAEVVEKQAQVQKSLNEMESKKSSALSSKSAAVAMLKTLDQESAEFARLQKKLADEQDKIDAEINAYLAAQGSSNGEQIVEITNDGSLIWPLPYPNCYISAYFGQYPSGGAHHGLDICVHGGTKGKNVVAAQSGKVIKMGYGHYSMGNYIILDHGNGLFTAYYHGNDLCVGHVGQIVKQGQVIMHAGETGNTTGPHLHFEVRVKRNGTVVQVNPLNYVSMP